MTLFYFPPRLFSRAQPLKLAFAPDGCSGPLTRMSERRDGFCIFGLRQSFVQFRTLPSQSSTFLKRQAGNSKPSPN
jgi:hypothetical protein